MAGKGQEVVVKKGSNVVAAHVEKSDVALTHADNAFFNYLLQRAQTEFAKDFLNANAKVHRIPMREAMEFMQCDRPAKVKESVERLCQANIRVDYESEEGDRSLSCHLLSMDMSNAVEGFLHFAFDPILWHFIKDPKVYALIEVNRVRDIRFVPGQRLYEHMELIRRRRNSTWTVGIEELREIFGAADSHKRFDNFRKNVIEKAVDAVNAVAPSFDVLVEYNRSGRGGPVVSVTFKPVSKSHHRLIEASATKASGVRRKAPKDPNTIDLLDGKTAVERGGPAEITSETLERASELVGDGGNVDDLLLEWRESSKTKVYNDPNRAFLAWVEMKVERDSNAALQDVDDDVFGTLLGES